MPCDDPRRITRIRPPKSSAQTIPKASVFDAWSGSVKARSSASDLISASGAERIWSSAPNTYRDSAAGSLSGLQESGGAGKRVPRVLEIDGCPHAVPIKGVQGRLVGASSYHRVRGWGRATERPRLGEREGVQSKRFAAGLSVRGRHGVLEAQIERSWWGVVKRIGPEGSSYTLGSPSLLRIRRWRGTGRHRRPGSA